MASSKAHKSAQKPVTVRMIRVIVTTSEGRSESTIKAPHATEKMFAAAKQLIGVMSTLKSA